MNNNPQNNPTRDEIERVESLRRFGNRPFVPPNQKVQSALRNIIDVAGKIVEQNGSAQAAFIREEAFAALWEFSTPLSDEQREREMRIANGE